MWWGHEWFPFLRPLSVRWGNKRNLKTKPLPQARGSQSIDSQEVAQVGQAFCLGASLRRPRRFPGLEHFHQSCSAGLRSERRRSFCPWASFQLSYRVHGTCAFAKASPKGKNPRRPPLHLFCQCSSLQRLAFGGLVDWWMGDQLKM